MKVRIQAMVSQELFRILQEYQEKASITNFSLFMENLIKNAIELKKRSELKIKQTEILEKDLHEALRYNLELEKELKKSGVNFEQFKKNYAEAKVLKKF